MTIKVYPIPTSDEVNLEMEKDGNFTIEVFNRNGKLLKSLKLVGSNLKVDLSEFPSGLYVLRLLNDKKEFETVKVVKE